MKLDELLDALRISDENLVKEGDKYVIYLNDSDEYQSAYIQLSKSDIVDLDDESTIVTEHSNIMKYLADNFDITLECDFDKDIYKIIFEEV